MSIEIPLLFYFQKTNEYSGAKMGMRYFLSPRKEVLLDEAGSPILDEKGKEQTKPVLEVHIWPDPWALNRTDPALRKKQTYPLSEAGRTEAIAWLNASYEAEFARWQAQPSILDSEPWYPTPAPEEEETPQ